MRDPYIAPSAFKRGISPYDVRSMLEEPDWIMGMPELVEVGLGIPERPYVIVVGGHDLAGEPLVVFVDRFRSIAFHSEPGSWRYGRLF